ncbi:hypothetical protein V1477_020072 [Vespula maculifrons]|uniref:Uncharacterized protein n=1 Tax=Vespula maculifrons TaxID=7453 RepID=A0ABD2ALQ3_VESMC
MAGQDYLNVTWIDQEDKEFWSDPKFCDCFVFLRIFHCFTKYRWKKIDGINELEDTIRNCEEAGVAT